MELPRPIDFQRAEVLTKEFVRDCHKKHGKTNRDTGNETCFLEGPLDGTNKPRRFSSSETQRFSAQDIIEALIAKFDPQLLGHEGFKPSYLPSLRILAWLAGHDLDELEEKDLSWDWKKYWEQARKHFSTLFPEFMNIIEDLANQPDSNQITDETIKKFAQIFTVNGAQSLSVVKGYASKAVLDELEKPASQRIARTFEHRARMASKVEDEEQGSAVETDESQESLEITVQETRCPGCSQMVMFRRIDIFESGKDWEGNSNDEIMCQKNNGGCGYQINIENAKITTVKVELSIMKNGPTIDKRADVKAREIECTNCSLTVLFTWRDIQQTGRGGGRDNDRDDYVRCPSEDDGCGAQIRIRKDKFRDLETVRIPWKKADKIRKGPAIKR